MSEREAGLSPDQLRAVNELAGAESNGAGLADCESEAVAGWSGDDPEFIAALNRAKSFRTERLRADLRSLASDAMATRTERLRADLRSLASDAMATMRELVTSPGIAPTVRLRVSLAILQSVGVLKADEIGPRTAEGVQAKIAHDQFIESLGG